MLFGHLAVAALEHRYARAALVPVTAAAVFPDAVDKVAHYILGHHATGRMYGHTLLAGLVTTLVVVALFGKHNAASWLLGYLSHLVCDVGGVIPWLAPFVAYEFPPQRTFAMAMWAALTRPLIFLEVVLLIWAAIVIHQELESGRLKLRPSRQIARD
jgi:hypothetical protein